MICKFCLKRMEHISSYGDGWNNPVKETYKCDCGAEVTTMASTVVWEEPKRKYNLGDKIETILRYASNNGRGNLVFSYYGEICISPENTYEEWFGLDIETAVDKVLNDFMEEALLKECGEDEI